MKITRTMATAALGLALVVGGVGCGQAAEKVAERAAEEAADQSGDCQDIDISSDGSVSGTCGGTDFDADAGGDVEVSSEDGGFEVGSGADVPEGWPSDLEVVEGLDVLYTTADELGLNVTGNLDGDLAEVSEGIKGDLESAGFTIDSDATADEGDGRMGTAITATSPEFTATLAITETPNDPKGDLTVVYLLVPVAG